jgi:hypothetical protein
MERSLQSLFPKIKLEIFDNISTNCNRSNGIRIYVTIASGYPMEVFLLQNDSAHLIGYGTTTMYDVSKG